ncbi:single-stranded DNA-binding protein [uncultured Mitsuokella sp.]|uniref:single-stranded DNA-binding protein n=1 Tax=uncultured Mitsuokella sp. TaxID=453120 RepID=UPI0026DAAB6E|nr:single-stranded DNA-binding protein [uncultured Mitsuokella sp.]
MNHVTLIGRLTKDPDVRYTQSGNTVATFTLAVDRRVPKDKPKEADFIPCVVWGKTAEVVERWCKKGKQLAVEGRIQVRSYDAKDGSKRYVTEVIVNELELLGSKNDSGSQQSGGRPQLSDEEIPF